MPDIPSADGIVATPEQRLGAEAAYTPFSLRLYDLAVHGLSNRFLWRCPTEKLTGQYERYLSARHLDVGVGTGYFLDRARLPVEDPAITLLDLNPHCLDAAALRVARFAPRTVLANLFEPLPDIGPFESASLTYVLHCLPGAIPEKAVIFDRIAATRRLMSVYNGKGIFSNRKDCLEDLEAALKSRFDEVSIDQCGLVALFAARGPVPV